MKISLSFSSHSTTFLSTLRKTVPKVRYIFIYISNYKNNALRYNLIIYSSISNSENNIMIFYARSII